MQNMCEKNLKTPFYVHTIVFSEAKIERKKSLAKKYFLVYVYFKKMREMCTNFPKQNTEKLFSKSLSTVCQFVVLISNGFSVGIITHARNWLTDATTGYCAKQNRWLSVARKVRPHPSLMPSKPNSECMGGGGGGRTSSPRSVVWLLKCCPDI